MMGYRNIYRYGYGMTFWGGFIWILLLIFLIVIAIVVYKITTGRRNLNNNFNNSAIEILKQRYARGEIDEEQYRKMRDAIEKK